MDRMEPLILGLPIVQNMSDIGLNILTISSIGHPNFLLSIFITVAMSIFMLTQYQHKHKHEHEQEHNLDHSYEPGPGSELESEFQLIP
jgi:hypothetical protein